MPIVEISDVGRHGISKDNPNAELSPGVWTDAKNMTFLDNSATKVEGYTQVFGDLASGANPCWMMSTVSQANTIYWIYASLTNIYATDGTTHADIGEAAKTYGASLDISWNGGNLNGIPVLNNGADVPQYWTDWDVSTPALCADIPGFALTYDKATVIKPFLNYLIAIDVTESATKYPFLVAWSDSADAGSLPASWDYTSTTNRAGQVPLSGNGGFLIDAVSLGNTMFIYKETATYSMRLIGGNEVWDFKEVFQNSGILTRNCAVEVMQQHVVMTKGDVILHNGSQYRSILAGSPERRRLRDWFFAQIDTDNFERSYVVTDPTAAEVLCCIPEAGKNFPTLALIWNYQNDTIGVRDLTENLTSGANVMYGVPFIVNGIINPSTDETWNTGSDIWDTGTDIWNESTFNPANQKLLYAMYGETVGATDGKLFASSAVGTVNGDNFEAYLERTGLAIIGRRNDGSPNVDIGRNKFVRAIYPRVEIISGTGAIKVYVGSQLYLDDMVSWEGPFSFDPLTDKRINCTVNGRFIAVKFANDNSTNLLWRLSGYALEIEAGARW